MTTESVAGCQNSCILPVATTVPEDAPDIATSVPEYTTEYTTVPEDALDNRNMRGYTLVPNAPADDTGTNVKTVVNI